MPGLSARLPALVAGALPVLFIPISVDAYILPRAGLVLAGAGMAAALAIWLWSSGWTGGARLGPLRWPAVAVVAAALLAFAFSAKPVLSAVGSYSRYESLPMRAAYVGLFCSAVWLLRSRADRARVVTWFLFGCGVAGVEGIWQGASHAIPQPDGNLGQHNLFGVLMAMAAVLAFGRALAGARWWPLAVLLAIALFVSTSRSGWLGAVVGAVACAVLWLRGPRLVGVATVGGAVAVGVVLLVVAAGPLRNLNGDTGTARVGVWRDTLPLIEARPVTGWGEEGFGLVFGRFQTADWEPGHSFDRAHSEPLDLLATQGVIGFAACFWFWALLAGWIWRARASAGAEAAGGRGEEIAGLGGALAAYGVWSILNFDWAPATGPAWLLGGVAWSALPAPAEARAVVVGAAIRILGVAGAGCLALGSWALAVAPLVADLDYYAGRPGWAAAAFPWQARYHQALGEAETGPARLIELRRAADLGSTESGLWIELGDSEAEAGHPGAARHAWQMALDIYRYEPTARERLGRSSRSP